MVDTDIYSSSCAILRISLRPCLLFSHHTFLFVVASPLLLSFPYSSLVCFLMWPLLFFLACSSYFHFWILVLQSCSLMIWRWDTSKLHWWYFCHPVDWSAVMTTCWVLLIKRVTLQLMSKHPLMGYISVKPCGGCSLQDACSVCWSFGKLRDILYPTSKICVIKCASNGNSGSC